MRLSAVLWAHLHIGFLDPDDFMAVIDQKEAELLGLLK